MTKLEKLAESEGYPDVEFLLAENCTDSVVPGICCNPNCDYTTEVEPDQDAGWCEVCAERSVKSCLILADII